MALIMARRLLEILVPVRTYSRDVHPPPADMMCPPMMAMFVGCLVDDRWRDRLISYLFHALRIIVDNRSLESALICFLPQSKERKGVID